MIVAMIVAMESQQKALNSVSLEGLKNIAASKTKSCSSLTL